VNLSISNRERDFANVSDSPTFLTISERFWSKRRLQTSENSHETATNSYETVENAHGILSGRGEFMKTVRNVERLETFDSKRSNALELIVEIVENVYGMFTITLLK
jgi:hypothetical protein